MSGSLLHSSECSYAQSGRHPWEMTEWADLRGSLWELSEEEMTNDE